VIKLNITIKGVEEEVYRNFKAESVRRGFKLGEASTEAFKDWVASQNKRSRKDIKSMEEAARHMDRIRAKLKNWSGVSEIRKWREKRNYQKS